MKWKTDDTIAAIATPVGVGGIGIVRISGPAAPAIGERLFRPSGRRGLGAAESHKLLHGYAERDRHTLDEVLAVVMRAPHSYTGEDVVEIHCHGGALAVRAVLELACAEGARPAEAGEFTFRAFMNGRMDLTQVEAVSDLVRAGSRYGLQVSANQLRGRLHDAIATVRDEVSHVTALVEASIDFPDEDVIFTHREDCLRRLGATRRRLQDLLASADQGRLMREGLAVAIIGKPNVGKSSLLNAMLRENRAIVTEIPGTTRDTLEELLEMGGLALRLIDTAGIHDTTDVVERHGIDRSHRAVEQADLTLVILDGSGPLDEDDRRLLELAPPQRSLVVVNKRDLLGEQGPAWSDTLDGRPRIALSALTGEGMAGLEDWILGWAVQDERPVFENALITNLRQKHAAQRALQGVEGALGALERELGEELLSVDLKQTLDALGDIVGETTADDLLGRIFSEFCIGK